MDLTDYDTKATHTARWCEYSLASGPYMMTAALSADTSTSSREIFTKPIIPTTLCILGEITYHHIQATMAKTIETYIHLHKSQHSRFWKQNVVDMIFDILILY